MLKASCFLTWVIEYEIQAAVPWFHETASGGIEHLTIQS